jgi:hypothetical protein
MPVHRSSILSISLRRIGAAYPGAGRGRGAAAVRKYPQGRHAGPQFLRQLFQRFFARSEPARPVRSAGVVSTGQAARFSTAAAMGSFRGESRWHPADYRPAHAQEAGRLLKGFWPQPGHLLQLARLRNGPFRRGRPQSSRPASAQCPRRTSAAPARPCSRPRPPG